MKKQTGFTLIEIMIALLLGLIVLGATINIYVTTVGSSASLIKSTRLNHDLESVMTLMINDIKRSGYWGGATIGANSGVNPFTAATPPGATTDIQIPVNTCILYSYDADTDGPANVTGTVTPAVLTDDVDANEYYGFRLTNNSIQMRKTGSTTDDCTDGEWEEFIDGSRLTITALNFSFAPLAADPAGPFPELSATSGCSNVTTSTSTSALDCETTSAAYIALCSDAANPCFLGQKRVVNIQLKGQVTGDTSIKTLTAALI
jgi:type IV pilus assembly protein PilW